MFGLSPMEETPKPKMEVHMTLVRKTLIAGFSALTLGAAMLAPTAASAEGFGIFIRVPVFHEPGFHIHHPGVRSCTSVTVRDVFGNRITRKQCRSVAF
jgi:hypothetical protein